MLMKMMVKLANWYCVGSQEVMRRSSAFKVTEDIDPHRVIRIVIIIFLLSVIIFIDRLLRYFC